MVDKTEKTKRYSVSLTYVYDVEEASIDDAINEAYRTHYQEAQYEPDADDVEVFDYGES